MTNFKSSGHLGFFTWQMFCSPLVSVGLHRPHRFGHKFAAVLTMSTARPIYHCRKVFSCSNASFTDMIAIQV